jgi:hypothetical protein
LKGTTASVGKTPLQTIVAEWKIRDDLVEKELDVLRGFGSVDIYNLKADKIYQPSLYDAGTFGVHYTSTRVGKVNLNIKKNSLEDYKETLLKTNRREEFRENYLTRFDSLFNFGIFQNQDTFYTPIESSFSF